jgi:DNA replication protein DnaC
MREVFGQYRRVTLGDYQVQNESQARAVAAVGQYIENLEDNRQHGKGLTLLGPNGVGKTMLANIVIKAAQDLEYRVEAIELASYVNLHKEKFGFLKIFSSDRDDVIDTFLQIRTHIVYIQGHADLVLFDDVGREFPSESGWSQNEFFDTLRFRWNRCLPSLLTSNLPLSDLEQRYTEGLTSLLREATEIILVKGDDYRCRKDSLVLQSSDE